MSRSLIGRLRLTLRNLLRKKRNGDRGEMLPSGLPSRIGDSEKLSRFLTSNRHFSRNKGIVKPGAFLPNPSGETSVFRHSGDPVHELWEMGRTNLPKAVNIHGAGVVDAAKVREAFLEVAASEPPPRHANIEGWPTSEDPDLAKAARKEAAIVIARHALLLLR